MKFLTLLKQPSQCIKWIINWLSLHATPILLPLELLKLDDLSLNTYVFFGKLPAYLQKLEKKEYTGSYILEHATFHF